MLKITTNEDFKLKTQYSNKVLFDTRKILSATKSEQVKKVIQDGKNKIYEFKHKRNSCKYGLQQQLTQYKPQMREFYRQEKINIVTENDLKRGLGRIDSRDPLALKRQAYDLQR